jgi:hypothetical protein
VSRIAAKSSSKSAKPLPCPGETAALSVEIDRSAFQSNYKGEMKRARQIGLIAAALGVLAVPASVLGHLLAPVIGAPTASELASAMRSAETGTESWAALWLAALPSTITGALALAACAGAGLWCLGRRRSDIPAGLRVGAASAGVTAFALMSIPPPGFAFSLYLYVFTAASVLPLIAISALSERLALLVFRVGAPYWPAVVGGLFVFLAAVLGGLAGAAADRQADAAAPGSIGSP